MKQGWVLWLVTVTLATAREYRDPSAGFRVDLPAGWQAVSSGKGHIVMASPNPQMYAFVQPVLNRTSDCVATLRQTLGGGGFANVTGLDVVNAGPRLATAKFVFQKGQVQGAMLCAETSRRGGMLYGIAAPIREFARQAPGLLAVLRSFSFEAVSVPPAAGAAAAPPPLNTTWQEPREMAYTLAIPQGWRAEGGIHRLDVTHYTSGVQVTSPDGASVIRIGDQRLKQCTVPGPGAASMPSTGGLNYCQMQAAGQFGAGYLRTLARDLGLRDGQILSSTDRPDLAEQAQALPASFGLRMRISIAEIRFRAASRNGTPLEGGFLAQSSMFYAVQGQNFILGTQSFDINGYVGPSAQAGVLARLTGAIRSSQRINPVWWSQTQQINRDIANRTLATLHAEAEHQQQAFWDRIAASDRRREGVNDILGGTVRLTDGGGNRYQAKAGSNYYFLDTEAAKTAGRPDDAVRRGDLWPSPMVDLRPLEVIR